VLLNYALTRLRFTRKFEPDGGSFLYRSRPTAAAIRVTGAEKDELLRVFRREYWFNQLGTLGTMFVLLVLLVALAFLMPAARTDSFVMGGTVAIMVPLIIAALILDRRLMNLPARRFPNRAPATPGRSWLEARKERAQRRSWFSYAAWILPIVGLAWLFFPGAGAVWWALPAWIAYFGLCLVTWSYSLWQKFQFVSQSDA